MPKATSKSVHVSHTSANESQGDFNNSQEPNENDFQEDCNILQESSSDEKIVLKGSQPQPSTSQIQVAQQVYMPYIDGPKMN